MIAKPKNSIPLSSQQPVSEAFKTILKHHFDYLLKWEETARSWQNTEGVHQMRVTIRRMRSALKLFRPAVGKLSTRPWSETMGWFAGQFGLARDLDVLIDEGLESVKGKLNLPGAPVFTELAERHRAEAYKTVINTLDSQHYADFKREFVNWLDNDGWLRNELTPEECKWLAVNLFPFARKCLNKQTRRVLTAGNEVDQNSPQAMHQLRIECKKLRYAAEFFSPVFSNMDDFIGHLKGLQDVLGTMNDVSVMHHLLEPLFAETQDPEVLQYGGGLIGWRTRQYYEIKDTFDDRWHAFTKAQRPW